MDSRPSLTKNILLKDFKEFYWLKEELLLFCRQHGLAVSGSKIDIALRIENFLLTGVIKPPISKVTLKPKSKFDWKTENLSLETIITDSYQNTEKVRIFFVEQLGPSFKFNILFMNWMKANNGKTLEEAIAEWQRLRAEKKANKNKKEIAPQFEYNRYLRDFLADNPSSNREQAISFWKIKKAQRGDNIYKKSDLELLG